MPNSLTILPAGVVVPLVNEGQEEVFRRNVVIFQPLRFFLGLDEEFAQTLGQINFPGFYPGTADSRLPFQFLLETVVHPVSRYFHELEQLREQSVRLFEQRQ